MHLFTLVNPGLELLAQQEIKELVKAKATINGSALEFSVKNKKDVVLLAQQAQSFRRLLILLGRFDSPDSLAVEELAIPWTDYFPPQFSFKVEVQNVSGQENRFELAKMTAGKLFSTLEKQGLKPTLEVKKPQYIVVVYFTGSEYLLGLDCCGKDFDGRDYRVFPHQATFKGDLAYYFLRSSGYTPGEKLLIGFVRDGGLAIEAALYANKISLRSQNLILSTFPNFASLSPALLSQEEFKQSISAFDINPTNLIAAKKNAKLAKVSKFIDFHKLTLDELDVRFSPEQFDRIIFHLTKKDEDKINEMYYQANYVLKKGGFLFIIARSGLELAAPEGYVLKLQQDIKRGESSYRLWLMGKKN